jgi:hypothetical protein
MGNMGRFRKEEINREFSAGERESVQGFAKALRRGEIGNAKLGVEERSEREAIEERTIAERDEMTVG